MKVDQRIVGWQFDTKGSEELFNLLVARLREFGHSFGSPVNFNPEHVRSIKCWSDGLLSHSHLAVKKCIKHTLEDLYILSPYTQRPSIKLQELLIELTKDNHVVVESESFSIPVAKLRMILEDLSTNELSINSTHQISVQALAIGCKTFNNAELATLKHWLIDSLDNR